MLHLLDNLLRHLFLTQIDELTDAGQVGFQPPDEKWRQYVSQLNVDGKPASALNVYLAELGENRTLRSNERTRTIENGTVSQKPVPARLDAHYLITAWSPAEAAPDVEPAIDEHGLLYHAAAVLFNAIPFNPSRIYGHDAPPLQHWPPAYRDAELPGAFATADTGMRFSEFWSSMGDGARWKPALRLVVTLPVELIKAQVAAMVTHRIIKYRLPGEVEIVDEFTAAGATATPDSE